MISFLSLFMLFALFVLAIIDWKVQKIPSILLTGLLFLVASIEIMQNPISLNFGVLGLIMAYLLYEADFFSGIADLKIMVAISFMATSIFWLMGFIILVLIYGIIWKGLWKWRISRKGKKVPAEFPFIPVMFFVYLALYILGGVA